MQNLPGGGSMIAANQMYNVVKPDGLTVAMLSSGLYFDQLLGAKEVKYDWAKFGWVGSPVKNFEVLSMRNDTPYKTIEDIQIAAQPPRCGTTGSGATGHYFPKFLDDALGAKFHLVLGYPVTARSRSPSNGAKSTATRSPRKHSCANRDVAG